MNLAAKIHTKLLFWPLYTYILALHLIKYNISFVVIILDAAKSNNTPEDMIVYSVLGSPTNLTVKFHMNPVDNYTVDWSMDGSEIQDTSVTDIVTQEHVQTTYFITNVTNKHLGNYTCRVINREIKNNQKGSIFNVRLKLRGKIIILKFSYFNHATFINIFIRRFHLSIFSQ